jgi:hypothetical protein
MANSGIKIQILHDNNAAFSGIVLSSGEPAYAIDTGSLRVGDGTNSWNNLATTIVSRPQGVLGASGVNNIVVMTSGAYSSLGSYDQNTIYFIT